MFNIGGGEMIVIFLLALLVLGPERLPKAMGQVGRAVAQMRKLSSGFQDEIRRAMDPIEAPFRPGEQTLPGPMPSITDEVRVVATEEPEPVALAEDDPAEPVALAKDEPVEPVALSKDEPDEPVALVQGDTDAEPAVEPATQAPVVGDEPPRRASVTPLRPRVEAEGGTDDGGDRATG